MRVWREFPSGPEGIFLKRGRDVQGVALASAPPFVEIDSRAGSGHRRACTTASRSSIRCSRRRSCGCSAPTAFWCFTRVLMTLCFACAYAFLVARSAPMPALRLCGGVSVRLGRAGLHGVADAGLLQSRVRADRVFLLGLQGGRRRIDDGRAWAAGGGRWLLGPRSDLVAAVLLGIATFSKPTHVLLIAPLLVLFAWRRQWLRGLIVGSGLRGRASGSSPGTWPSPASGTTRAAKIARRSTARSGWSRAAYRRLPVPDRAAHLRHDRRWRARPTACRSKC